MHYLDIRGEVYYYLLFPFCRWKKSKSYQDFLWPHSLDRTDSPTLCTFHGNGVCSLLLSILQVTGKVIFSCNGMMRPRREHLWGTKRGPGMAASSELWFKKAFWSEQLANSCVSYALRVVNFNHRWSLSSYCASGTELSQLLSQWGNYCYYPHFTIKKSETVGG